MKGHDMSKEHQAAWWTEKRDGKTYMVVSAKPFYIERTPAKRSWFFNWRGLFRRLR